MKQLIFIALSIILLAQYSCKKVQPEMKSLDCSCAKEVSANFTMEERGMFFGNNIDDYLTETDTILDTKNVKFTAKEADAEYTWYVGTEIINTRSLVRFFSDNWIGQTVPITLVVKKKPNSICFPNDDGKDSITKFLTIQAQQPYSNLKYIGTFRVKSPFLPDSFDITTKIETNGWGNDCFNIYNYDGNGASCAGYMDEFLINYNQIWFGISSGISNCNQITGNFLCKHKDRIEMKFSTGIIPYNNVVNYEYSGRKL
jgi:hypothetical protein